jgi:hypothetical protein
MQRFDAFGAGFDPFVGRQSHPLEIGIFSFFAGRVVFAAQLDKRGGHSRTLAADSASFCHNFMIWLLFIFI